jgi:hypothetical protein
MCGHLASETKRPHTMTRRTRPFNFCLVDTDTGVGRAFCCTGCLAAWLRWWKEPIKSRYQLGYPVNQAACQHCFLCGDRTGYDGPCAIHDDGCCPEHDWSHTYASTVVSPIVSQVLARPLDDADYLVMEQVYNDREPQDHPWDMAMKAVDIIRST